MAAEIAKSARPFYEGEFVKKCMVKVCDSVCPNKKQDFLNVSLSRNTVVESVCELSTNLHKQLIRNEKDFIAYFFAVDESSDTSDTAQWSIFIRGVDSSLCVTKELLRLKSMHSTITGKDIFKEVSKCITEMSLPWNKLVGLTTDSAPKELIGRQSLEEDASELAVYHCIIHQEALCGKALQMEHAMSCIS